MEPISVSNAPEEGPWSEVCKAIQECHRAVHELGAPRIATDIRIGTRIDKTLTPGTANDEKLARVQEILKEWDNKGSNEEA
ncbi:hypothetical protein FRC17_001686 [Serendipita sp. 399]|nr:hypothetical protein FRC17_001686 [Serendipita sp. 399]